MKGLLFMLTSKIAYYFKQLAKILIQILVLPTIYRCICLVYKNNPQMVILADAHHTEAPSSMKYVAQMLREKDILLEEYYWDYSRLSLFPLFKAMFQFMKRYSQARYVFICDNFLQVASCRKRPETTVIQLWHGAGALKKFGYDSADDIPSWYKGNVFKNYDLVTVSSRACVRPFASAMKLTEKQAKPLGISRTDCYFDQKYLQSCRENLYQRFPEIIGKKLLLWAPTFRERPTSNKTPGLKEIERLEAMLGPSWKVIKKFHPHIKAQHDKIGSAFSAEELLPLIDYLVTDYSSIIFDYLLFEHPFAFYVPDLEEYTSKRGLYISLDELPGEKVRTAEELYQAVITPWGDERMAKVKECRKRFMEACDGQATKRILEEIGID